MQKQHDGRLFVHTPVRQTMCSTKGNAPETAISEAANKFLNQLIQGNSAMNTTVSSNESQVSKLAIRGIDAASLAQSQAETIAVIFSAIARLSQDDTITKLAIHGDHVSTALSDDMHYFIGQIEEAKMGVSHE